MKKIKHSKYRNSGFLFELLVRQVTADIIRNKKKSLAESLLSKYFSPKKEMAKEMKLYQLLLREKYNSEISSGKFIDAVLEVQEKLSRNKLNREKYNLIKEIKDNYPIDDFLRSPISEYKVLASIYKMFEYNNNALNETYDPADVIKSRITVMYYIMDSKTKNPDVADKDALIEDFKKQTKHMKLITYRLLIDKFNDKYGSTLNDKQKNLLREYVNNVANTNSLRQYINKEIPAIKKELIHFQGDIKDPVTLIKLTEIVSQLDSVKRGKIVKESQISALMIAYELIEELKNVTTG